MYQQPSASESHFVESYAAMCITGIHIFHLLMIIAVCEGYIVGEIPSRSITLQTIKLDDLPVTTLDCQVATCASASTISCIRDSYNQSAFLIGYNKSHLLSCFLLSYFPPFNLNNFIGTLYRRRGRFFICFYTSYD